MSKSLSPFYFDKRGVSMADTIDSLQIEINAQASKANDAIDRLVGKIDRLTTSLTKVDGSKLTSLANGVQRLGTAMQIMNNVSTADFTRLASNLTKLGSINVSALNSAASSMSHLARAFNSLGTVSANAQAVGDMARNIAKLGNANVQRAIVNIPQLATAMNNLMATLSKAPQVSQNVIQMTNALANLASQGQRVGTASRSLVSGLNNSSNAATKAKKSFGGLASAIGKFYATYFMVIRGLKGPWHSIESTADYIEAYNYFNVALGKIGKDWSYQWEQYGYDNAESYTKSFSKRLSESLGKLSGLQVSIGADGKGLLTETGMKNLGLNIQEITQYASQLASVTNSVGQTGETSIAIASSFTKLAGDISSLFNVDYSSVAKNLQSGLIGQSRALYKYGIDITNATLQTKAYELGLSKAVSEMTQAEKMQLRMLAILDQSKVSWGDLANTINSPSNMIRQFTNNLRETGMVLGQLFIPLLQKVMPIINGVTIAIKRLLVSIAGLFGIKIDFDAFGQGYSDLEDGIGGISDSLDDVASSAKKANAGLRAFDELKVINAPDTSGVGTTGGVSGGIDLTDEILKATSEYQKVWNEAFDKMQSKAQEFADKLESIAKSPAFKMLSSGLLGFLGTLAVFEVGGWAYNAFLFISTKWQSFIANPTVKLAFQVAGVAAAIEWLHLVSEEVANSAGSYEELLDASREALGGFFGTLYANTVELFSGKYSISDIMGALFNVETWKDVIDNIVSGYRIIGSAIQESINEWKENWRNGWDIIARYFNEFCNMWKNGWNSVFLFAKEIWSNIVSFFSSSIPNWWNSQVAPWFTKKKWMDMFANAKQGLKDGWNSFVDWLQNTALIKWWNNLVGYFRKDKWTFTGIKDGLSSAWNSGIEAIKQIWNNFANWLNEKLTWTIDPIIIGGKTLFSGTTINMGKIPTFSTGGFPEDGLFMANRDELVGQFSNGRTAVANNEQITEGIKQGVKEAVSEILAPYLADIAQNTRETANKEFGITESAIGKAARNYAKDYTTRTGRPAYNF